MDKYEIKVTVEGEGIDQVIRKIKESIDCDFSNKQIGLDVMALLVMSGKDVRIVSVKDLKTNKTEVKKG